MPDSEIVPGTILAGRYRVESVIGRGGMGVVFAARHLMLGDRVAVKVLSRPIGKNEDALARLQREARILARVRNDHVVRVIDLGQLEDGAPFVVMEHLGGRDLGSWLEDHGRFAPERAVGFVLQALVALAAAHNVGVVHRDLKPENLFCVERDDGALLIKVLDFGISRLERTTADELFQSSVTRTNTTIGTPLYMSPEQLRNSKEADARSDIWSLGVVLYELLTGVLPFTGASFGDVAINVATDRPRSLEGLDPPLDPGLVAIVLRCLEKDRERRFQNVAELARALSPFGPAGCDRIVERIERILLRSPPDRADLGGSCLAELEEDAIGPDRARAAGLSEAATIPSPAAFRSKQQRRRSFRLRTILIPTAALAVLGLAWRLSGARSAESATLVEASNVGPEGFAGAPIALASRPEVSVALPTALSQDSGISSPTDVPSKAPNRSSSDARGSAAAPSPIRPATRKPGCNPPYTVDTQGRKKFRHECFTERHIP